MRKFAFVLLVMLFFFPMLQPNVLVLGLQQNQASADLSWSKKTYYQGESGTVIITIDSQCPEELKINKIQVQFDWTTNHNTTTKDLSDDPSGIPSNDNHVFDPIAFQVPNNATEGNHNIQVKIEGIQHGLLTWYDFEWISDETQIEIKTNYQQLYNQISTEVFTSLNEAQNVDYKNEDVKDLLIDATTEYSLALSLATQKKWDEAISHLQQTQDYLQQIQEKEQQISNEDLVTNATTIIVLILVGLLVSIILSRKTKKLKKSSEKETSNQFRLCKEDIANFNIIL